MKVLITGGAGFIGSMLADDFIKDDVSVVVADDLSAGRKENINPAAEFIKVDIASPDFEKVFEKHKFDAVFHFAAQTGVARSRLDPFEDAQRNIIAAINLFSLCKKYSATRVIAISSAAVYGAPKYLPIDEAHPLSPLSFYGLSKLTMEKYLKMFELDYTILRPSNVFGHRQTNSSEAGVIKIFENKIKAGEPVQIYGNGNQTRDFIHIDDFVRVLRLCLEKNVSKRTLNVSTGKGTSINELYEILHKVLLPGERIAGPLFLPPQQGDIKDSVLDNSLMKELLDFEPENDIFRNLNRL